MIDFILDVLTYIVIYAQIAGLIIGVIAFFLAATWMQANEGSTSHDET